MCRFVHLAVIMKTHLEAKYSWVTIILRSLCKVSFIERVCFPRRAKRVRGGYVSFPPSGTIRGRSSVASLPTAPIKTVIRVTVAYCCPKLWSHRLNHSHTHDVRNSRNQFQDSLTHSLSDPLVIM